MTATAKPIHETKEDTIKRLKSHLECENLSDSVKHSIEKKIKILTHNKEVLK